MAIMRSLYFMKDKLEKRVLKIKRPKVDWFKLFSCIRSPLECGYFYGLKYGCKVQISDNRAALATLRHYRGDKFVKWVQCQVAVIGFDRFLKEGSLSYV